MEIITKVSSPPRAQDAIPGIAVSEQPDRHFQERSEADPSHFRVRATEILTDGDLGRFRPTGPPFAIPQRHTLNRYLTSATKP